MTDSIFSDTDHVSTPKAEDLVGEGKKFKTIDDLARGKAESDRFIEQLTNELAEMRSQLSTRTSLEALIDRLETSRNDDPTTYTPNHGTQDGSQGSAGNALTEEDIERLLEAKLTNREIANTAKQNLEQAKDMLKQHFGSDFASKLEDRRKQLGIDKETLDTLAKRSPRAFMEMIAPAKRADNGFTPPASQVFTPNIGAGATGRRDWAFYEGLRKSDPDRYWSSEVQLQMHKDAVSAAQRGEDF